MAEVSDGGKDDPAVADYVAQVEDGLFSWLCTGFAPPIRYKPGGIADSGGRAFDQIVAGAMMTTRPKPDRSFFPPDNKILHDNLCAGFPEVVPDCLKTSASRYVVVENAGYVGERDVHDTPERERAESWMRQTYTPDETQELHVAVAHDTGNHRSYELL
ncbi:hypothetical protein [Novosphingobium sp. BL-52-GroH]|uniref:hypothetical protein n=1 Tax=Novosphingobium sp. BL-52-GroH TaxID=3349877 RepID=UPI00384A518A